MAKPNYSFAKRERERLKKKKKEEKLALRKAGTTKPEGAPADGPLADAPATGTTPEDPPT